MCVRFVTKTVYYVDVIRSNQYVLLLFIYTTLTLGFTPIDQYVNMALEFNFGAEIRFKHYYEGGFVFFQALLKRIGNDMKYRITTVEIKEDTLIDEQLANADITSLAIQVGVSTPFIYMIRKGVKIPSSKLYEKIKKVLNNKTLDIN